MIDTPRSWQVRSWGGPSLVLQNEIPRRQRMGAGQGQGKVREAVAIHVPRNARVRRYLSVAQLAGLAGKCGLADERERLISSHARVGVDQVKINPVAFQAGEVRDRVAPRRAGVRDSRIDKQISTGSTTQIGPPRHRR